jgi:hypothetical protein
VLPIVVALTAGLTGRASAWFQNEAPNALAGTFTVSIADDVLPAGMADGPALIGRWVLALNDDGTFTLARNDVGEVVTGTFTSGPATLTFETWGGIIGCAASGDESTGAAYAWRLRDDQLALTSLDDACAERLALLTSRPLGRVAACEMESAAAFDPFAVAEGTPSAAPTAASGVSAQEGYGEGADVEVAIDELLQAANGCWATADANHFMNLHSEGLRDQIAMMGPPEAFTQELRDFMEAPLTLRRIGDVILDDPNHAWAYVEIDLDGDRNPQRVNFVQEDGVWRLDSFFLFGPPVPGAPIGVVPQA